MALHLGICDKRSFLTRVGLFVEDNFSYDKEMPRKHTKEPRNRLS